MLYEVQTASMPTVVVVTHSQLRAESTTCFELVSAMMSSVTVKTAVRQVTRFAKMKAPNRSIMFFLLLVGDATFPIAVCATPFMSYSKPDVCWSSANGAIAWLGVRAIKIVHHRLLLCLGPLPRLRLKV